MQTREKIKNMKKENYEVCGICWQNAENIREYLENLLNKKLEIWEDIKVNYEEVIITNEFILRNEENSNIYIEGHKIKNVKRIVTLVHKNQENLVFYYVIISKNGFVIQKRYYNEGMDIKKIIKSTVALKKVFSRKITKQHYFEILHHRILFYDILKSLGDYVF